MRIGSTDASIITTITGNQESAPITKESRNPLNTIDNRNISQITEVQRRELSISDKIVIEAIEKANKAIMGGKRQFEFSIHEKTKQIMVKVIDSETNEVIREIPPEKILDMVATIWEMAGIIVDERR
jgi:flagellar protein FlaG